MKTTDLHKDCPACGGSGFGDRVLIDGSLLSPPCQVCDGNGTMSKCQLARYRMNWEQPPDRLVKDVIEEGGLA
jgi:DnaJ-class molecular chaperone